MVRVLLEILLIIYFEYFSVYILIIEKLHLFILKKNKYVKPFYILLSYLKKNNLLLLIKILY